MPVLDNSNTPRSIHFLRVNNIIGIAYCQFFFSLFLVYSHESCTHYKHILTPAMRWPCLLVHHCRFPMMSTSGNRSSAVICSNSSSIPLFNTIESRECEDSSDKISISYLLLFSLLIGLIQSLSAFTAFWTAAASPTAGFLFANRPQCKDDQQQQK